MEVKETIVNSGGRKYANSQFPNQNRADTISRVSAVQNSARGPNWEHWRSSDWNTRSHQHCRLRRDGNDSYGCPLLWVTADQWLKATSTLSFNSLMFTSKNSVCIYMPLDITYYNQAFTTFYFQTGPDYVVKGLCDMYIFLKDIFFKITNSVKQHITLNNVLFSTTCFVIQHIVWLVRHICATT